MSRVAKIPVVLGKGVEAKIENGFITVKGPKGTLSQKLNPAVEVTIDNGEVHFKAIEPTKFSNAMSGTLRALVNSMNIGVTEGFTKKLNLVGVGYKAQAQGNVLNLSLGFSHPVAYKMPEGIEVKTPTPTEIVIHGADKHNGHPCPYRVQVRGSCELPQQPVRLSACQRRESQFQSVSGS